MPRKRWRSGGGVGIVGAVGGGTTQPHLVVKGIGPKKIPNPKGGVCSECFRPRSRYRKSYFCDACDRSLFGAGQRNEESRKFIRAESARRTRLEKHHQGEVRKLMIRAALYAREFSGPDLPNDTPGVARQIEGCRELAKRKGWEVAESFIDKGGSREQYDLMMAALSAGRLDAVVCWSTDRLTRNPRELADVAERARDLATVMGKTVDFPSPQGSLPSLSITKAK